MIVRDEFILGMEKRREREKGEEYERETENQENENENAFRTDSVLVVHNTEGRSSQKGPALFLFEFVPDRYVPASARSKRVQITAKSY